PSEAAAEVTDHGVGHQERRRWMREHGRPVLLEDEVASEHDGITTKKEAQRPERPEGDQQERQPDHRPADEDVQDVIDRMAMVAAILRDEVVELGGGRT